MRELFEPPQRVPIRLWAEHVDKDALQQLQRLARCEYLAGPVAVMPDVHSAGVVCVGTVLATSGVVLPTTIGEDLGCGMAFVPVPMPANPFSHEQLERIVESIQECVPTGRRTHRRPVPLPDSLAMPLSTKSLNHQREWLGARHLGTLGGGNHFIELQRDTGGQLWLTVHTGSRGIGAAIASRHARMAAQGQSSHALPAMNLDSADATAFWSDLDWALAFARENRRCILGAVLDVLHKFTGERLSLEQVCDVAHNTISHEIHNGRKLIVHRKGAMLAPFGGRGIIPGSMGTASYIVEGLGNELSFNSCSHGAGRKLPRGETHRRISPEQLRREMAHVVYPCDPRIERSLIEESPSAYKDIKTVLREQADLVRPVLRLEPIAVVKG